MSSIPLYLKIKGSSNTTGDVPHFHQLSETTISFNETDYSFEHVFGDSTNNYSQLIDSNTNSCVLLMGPTASGKTTMLKQLVASNHQHLKVLLLLQHSRFPETNMLLIC